MKKFVMFCYIFLFPCFKAVCRCYDFSPNSRNSSVWHIFFINGVKWSSLVGDDDCKAPHYEPIVNNVPFTSTAICWSAPKNDLGAARVFWSNPFYVIVINTREILYSGYTMKGSSIWNHFTQKSLRKLLWLSQDSV